MKEAIKKLLQIDKRRQRKRLLLLEQLIVDGLPIELHEIGRFLVSDQSDEDTSHVVRRVEGLRSEIAAFGSQEVDILFSPKPGSAGSVVGQVQRPNPGKVLKFTMKRVAETGKDRRWGVVLYLLTRETKSENVLELGACAGLSACYMGSAACVEHLTTIEGSPALAELAKQTCGRISSKIRVINGLFNDVLDSILQGNAKIDMAYIDGHHEKIATLLYMNRILPSMAPGGWMVFDDICWSHDMNEAWVEICKSEAFSCAIDLGMIGVCRIKSENDDRQIKIWDMRNVVGHTMIQDPKEWTE